MLNIFAVRLLTIFLSLSGKASAQPTNNNCFTCASRRGYKMCRDTKFEHGWEVNCCPTWSTKKECKPTETNICSPTWTKSKHNFYSYCPKIESANCGLGGQNNLILEAYNEKQTFSFDGMYYKTKDWKIPSY